MTKPTVEIFDVGAPGSGQGQNVAIFFEALAPGQRKIRINLGTYHPSGGGQTQVQVHVYELGCDQWGEATWRRLGQPGGQRFETTEFKEGNR